MSVGMRSETVVTYDVIELTCGNVSSAATSSFSLPHWPSGTSTAH